jgi:prepilin-type N-terminal cleavage/methylation domain-containing protein
MNNRETKSTSGFTLVEILISVTILAVLLTAVAVAFDASVVNYNENEAIAKTMNTARQALLRMTTDIRTATAVAVDDPDNQQCSMILADGIGNITYRYNSADNTLYLDDNNSGSSYVLCTNVTAISFDRATVPGDPMAIRNVRISMTVSADDRSRTLSAAAVVRRNL